MLMKKYNALQREVKKHFKTFKKKISEKEFDAFIQDILSKKSLEVSGKVYCRDGFAYVNKLEEIPSGASPDVNPASAGLTEMRDDRAEVWDGRDEALRNAPEVRDSLFVVPRVVHKGDAGGSS